jgi:hypothetical protein
MRDPTERFSDRAEAYEKYRPGYPDDMLRFLEALVAPPAAVADIGSGTGILTRELLKSGYDAWAVEPNEAMREKFSRPIRPAGKSPSSTRPKSIWDGLIDRSKVESGVRGGQ